MSNVSSRQILHIYLWIGKDGDEEVADDSGILTRVSAAFRRDVAPILGRLPSYGKLTYALLTSPALAVRERTLLYIALGYQLSPIDLIPGFIPVIGQLDDLFVLLWALYRAVSSLPPSQAVALLSTANLTREDIESDLATVRRALGWTAGQAMAIIKRIAIRAMQAGLTSFSYLGLFTAALVQQRDQRK